MCYQRHYDKISGNIRHPVTMHLSRDVLAPAIFNDNPMAILDFYFEKRLLARNRVCPTCFHNMKLMVGAYLWTHFISSVFVKYGLIFVKKK